ncbi:arylamine N-acetyltransferase 1 [Crassisporium funariophilum]|nr:arylamine N-acetyltransferase 1 [Crassisporium funariophilum]
MPDDIRFGTLENGAWIKKASSCYTPAQALQWLDCMGLDLQVSEDDLTAGSLSTSLETLVLIVRGHLLTFPFENTTMHYSSEHYMDVTPDGVFKRIVQERLGGSYCFGLNGLLLEMLRALGYRAYSGAARVNGAGVDATPVYSSLSHRVIFVQPVVDSNRTYMVDVGFGVSGLAQPILLSNEDSNVVLGVGFTEKHKLTRSAHPSSSLESSRHLGMPTGIKWNLEVLHEKISKPANAPSWRILYTFSEAEFFPKDYRDASFVVSKMPDPQGLFWNNVVCVKTFVLEDEHAGWYAGRGMSEKVKSGEITYRMALIGKEVKRYFGGETEIIRTLTTEVERIQVLREMFSIDLDDHAAANIQGRASALFQALPL